ncbi:MAG: hypothetical protein JZU65_19140 [Chlorobium sp.]|nr:hypothetical protein [Chlorobium sp.]
MSHPSFVFEFLPFVGFDRSDFFSPRFIVTGHQIFPLIFKQAGAIFPTASFPRASNLIVSKLIVKVITMQTLAEFLKIEENRDVVLEEIINALRGNGEWGRRGLFAKIGNQISMSPAHVGQVLNKKKELTENFVEKIADYLETSVESLAKEMCSHNRIEVFTDMVYENSNWDELASATRFFKNRYRRELQNKAADLTEKDIEDMVVFWSLFLKIQKDYGEKTIDTLRELILTYEAGDWAKKIDEQKKS